jgi:hypothetical protein
MTAKIFDGTCPSANAGVISRRTNFLNARNESN